MHARESYSSVVANEEITTSRKRKLLTTDESPVQPSAERIQFSWITLREEDSVQNDFLNRLLTTTLKRTRGHLLITVVQRKIQQTAPCGML